MLTILINFALVYGWVGLGVYGLSFVMERGVSKANEFKKKYINFYKEDRGAAITLIIIMTVLNSYIFILTWPNKLTEEIRKHVKSLKKTFKKF